MADTPRSEGILYREHEYVCRGGICRYGVQGCSTSNLLIPATRRMDFGAFTVRSSSRTNAAHELRTRLLVI